MPIQFNNFLGHGISFVFLKLFIKKSTYVVNVILFICDKCKSLNNSLFLYTDTVSNLTSVLPHCDT